jgi:hypothetical protein
MSEIEKYFMPRKKSEIVSPNEWTVVIKSESSGEVKFMYDNNVDRYKLLGLLEVEIEMIKRELLGNMKKGP